MRDSNTDQQNLASVEITASAGSAWAEAPQTNVCSVARAVYTNKRSDYKGTREWRCYYLEVGLKTTRYFDEQIRRKRPYIRIEWCETALQRPLRRERQPDGRIRLWVFVSEMGRCMRVVTLEDGETVHNAFFDRGYREGDQ